MGEKKGMKINIQYLQLSFVMALDLDLLGDQLINTIGTGTASSHAAIQCQGYRALLPKIEEKFDPYHEQFRQDFEIDGADIRDRRKTIYKDHLLEELFDDLDSNNDKILTNSEFTL